MYEHNLNVDNFIDAETKITFKLKNLSLRNLDLTIAILLNYLAIDNDNNSRFYCV